MVNSIRSNIREAESSYNISFIRRLFARSRSCEILEKEKASRNGRSEGASGRAPFRPSLCVCLHANPKTGFLAAAAARRYPRSTSARSRFDNAGCCNNCSLHGFVMTACAPAVTISGIARSVLRCSCERGSARGVSSQGALLQTGHGVPCEPSSTRASRESRMPRNLWTFCALLSLAGLASTLENGLARTPPMGWLAWERFRCNTDCKNDPDNCISDQLFRTMTDIVVAEGYLAVGYDYINVDDCWLEKDRDFNGQLVPDRQRFPYGMKSLADYVHSKGLKFGIYEDYGNYTCAGYPGVLGYLETDAATFASWDVDYVKLDGCYSHPSDMDRGYPEFGFHLNQTGKAMVYSCSWPVYQIYAGMQPNYTAIIEHCNLWRNFDDIQDSWSSVESIIDYYGNNQDVIVPNAGPGHWNDPDMLIIGNFGLSYEQSKTQMALWAILAAPLLMSVDLRTIRPEYKAILQNKKIIAVDQDPLGIQGRRIYKHKGIEIWARPITPVYQNYYSYAIAFVNRRTDGTPSDVSVTLKELGLQYPGGYRVEDLYEDVDYGVLTPQTKIKVKVNPSGVVILRCNLTVEDVYRYSSSYTPLNQVFKIRQNSFK